MRVCLQKLQHMLASLIHGIELLSNLSGCIFYCFLFSVFFPGFFPVYWPRWFDLALAPFWSLDLSLDWNSQHFGAEICHAYGVWNMLVYAWFKDWFGMVESLFVKNGLGVL